MQGRHSGTATLFSAATLALFWAAMVYVFHLIAGGSTNLAAILWWERYWSLVCLIEVLTDLPPLLVAFAASERDFKIDRYLLFITPVIIGYYTYEFAFEGHGDEGAWAVIYASWMVFAIDAAIAFIAWYIRRMFRRVMAGLHPFTGRAP